MTGQNLDRLKKFLHVLPPSHNSVEQDKLTQELTEYQVHTRFYRDINVFHMQRDGSFNLFVTKIL